MRLWLRTALLAGATALAATGVTFALMSATAGPASQTFVAMEAGDVKIVSWRGEGDRLPPGPDTHWDGWPAPMFYTTEEEGAHPTDPEGKYPTGPWAPGDSYERALMVKNVGSLTSQLIGIEATLYGDEELASVFDVEVWAPKGQGKNSHLIYEGTLADLNGTMQPFLGNHDFLVLNGHSEVKLTFIITYRQDAANDLQGKTLKADFIIHAVQAANRP